MKKIAIVIIMSVIAALSLTACGESSYDLQSMFEPLTLTGYSDNISLEDPMIDYDMLNSVNDEDFLGLSEVLPTVEFTLIDADDAHNGDVVTVSASWDEELAAEYDIDFTNTSWQIKVSGLRERMTEEDVRELFSEGSATLERCKEMICADMSVYAPGSNLSNDDVVMESLYYIKDVEPTEVRSDWRPGVEGEVYLDRYAVVFRATEQTWYVMTCEYVIDRDDLSTIEPKFTGLPAWSTSYEDAMAMLEATSTDDAIGYELIEL